MSSKEQLSTYRYAGLKQVHSPGLSVDEASNRLQRLAYIEQRLMFLYASHVVTLPERDLKVLLGRLQYEAGQNANALRQRIQELRTPSRRLNKPPDKNLKIVFDHLDHLPGTSPFLEVLINSILPVLLEGYRDYLSSTNHLADYSSVRVVKTNADETEQHLQLLRAIYEDTGSDEGDIPDIGEWSGALERSLNETVLLTKKEPSEGELELKEPTEPFQIPRELRRDGTLRRVWDFEKPPLDQVDEHLDYMMSIRLSELNVAEGLALVLCETEDMPWDFYMDISRHLWDEMRHSLFGEAAIESVHGDRAALPLRDYEGEFVMEVSPLEGYAVLGLEIEGANMRYPPGKRQEWEFCRDMAKDRLMTTFQDYDWADEVLHVNIARRQLDKWFDGGLKFIGPYSKAGKTKRNQVKARYKPVLVRPSD